MTPHPPPSVSVLVVEDAPEFQDLIATTLAREGFAVDVCGDGATALARARHDSPAVVLLDVGLPDFDGTELCRQLRAFCDAYVIMVTERRDEIDRLIGLAVGADDYVVKPFSTRELVARIRAVLRRPRSARPTVGEAPSQPVVLGTLSIDVDAREVRVHDVAVELTRIEFDLLQTLARRPSMVFSRALLLERVWGSDWFGDDHVVDVHIANLRRKIDRNGTRHIRTVRGIGYQIARPATGPTSGTTTGPTA